MAASMNFNTNLIRMSQELRKIWIIKDFKTAGIGAVFLNIECGYENFRIKH